MYWPCTGARLGSQHTCGGSQPSANPVPGHLTPFLASVGSSTHLECRFTHVHVNKKYIFLKSFKKTYQVIWFGSTGRSTRGGHSTRGGPQTTNPASLTPFWFLITPSLSSRVGDTFSPVQMCMGDVRLYISACFF